MITLQEHIDALDKMVTDHASIPEIRSQIAFIAREVAALEADYMRSVDDNVKAGEENAKAIAALKEAHRQEIARLCHPQHPPSIEVINQAPDSPTESFM